MSKVIIPTVGRIVYYFYDPFAEAEAAIVCGVDHRDGEYYLNLAVFDSDGEQRSEPGVLLLQPGDKQLYPGHFCTWMPYQVKKATGSESGEQAAGLQNICKPEDDSRSHDNIDARILYALVKLSVKVTRTDELYSEPWIDFSPVLYDIIGPRWLFVSRQISDEENEDVAMKRCDALLKEYREKGPARHTTRYAMIANFPVRGN